MTTTPGVSIVWKGSRDHGLALAAEVKLVARQTPQMFLRMEGAFKLNQRAALIALIEKMGEEYLRLWENSDEVTRKLHETERKLAAAKALQMAAETDSQRCETIRKQQARIQQLTEGMAKLLRDIKDE